MSPTPLGRCPECNASIPRAHLLIEYDAGDEPAAYAECPVCEEVVRPSP